ncbi:MAG: DUF3131 domain-containing protein [Christensenellaceae bacterium]|nr:DUF3131 domain-containing protein [Christensenellaceae bacterium]
MTTTLLLAAIPAVYLLAMLLTVWLRSRGKPTPPTPADPLAAMALPSRGRARLLRPRRALRLMKQALRLPEEQAAVTILRSEHQALTAALLTLRRDMRRPPLLPCTADGEIRMLALARETLRHGQPEGELLLRMLEAFHSHGNTSLDERTRLPLCMRVLLADRLERALRRMLDCSAQARRGRKLATKFARNRHIAETLDRHPLPLHCLAALLTELRARSASEAVTQLDGWLAKGGTSAAGIARQEAQEQSRLAGSLTRIASAFQSLAQLDWPRLEEAADPLHWLLHDDPSGVYPRMDMDSRAMYRERVAWLARAFDADEQTVAQAALELCEEAEKDTLERHVGWYLLESEGVRALRKKLNAQRGMITTVVWLHADFVYRAGLWVLALAFAVLILGRGYTLWLLPVLLTVTGCISRALLDPLLRRFMPASHPPRLQLSRLTEDMRTLVVLPVQPRDRHEAILAVKQLATARRAMPVENVDCLLLADWTDNLTQRSGDDDDIALAIAAAIDALNEEDSGTRWLYLHRARVWSPQRRAFVARESRHGAIGMVCRLIAAGETDESLDFSSIEPSELHRRYAWVMVIENDARLEPGMLLTLAGAMAHPLNTRVNTAKGHRGVSLTGVLTASDPDDGATRLQRLFTRQGRVPLRQRLSGRSSFPGIGLIRPDVLLEGTDGWIQPESLTSAAWLAGELSGCSLAPVTAFIPAPETLNGRFLDAHEQARQVWQHFPWLFPFVKSPEGVRRNPLTLPSRFALRERFRRSLLPLCQLIALVVSCLHRDPWLLLTALLAPNLLGLSDWRGWLWALADAVFLPMRAYLCCDAAVRALLALFFPKLRQRPLSPDSLFVLELCSEIAVCALLAALSAFRFPLFLSGLLLAGVTACFPLAHRRLDATGHPPEELPSAAASQLTDIAAATWRFFEQTVTEESRWLPPETLQTHPDIGPAKTTVPDAIGLYLLSCLAARELGLTDTDELSERITQTLDSLEALPRWQGLPFARYSLDTLEPEEPKLIPAAACGVLCACLLTVAQGLRAFLPEVAEEDQTLPARVDAFAASMKLRALYDPQTGLFREHLNPARAAQDAPFLDLFADEGLLLSFVAVIRREVPFSHLDRLSRTQVHAGFLRPMISRHGGAAEALLPFLLLPAGEGTTLGRSLRDTVWLQTRYALDGVFGVGKSACSAFDDQLRYTVRPFGVPEASLESVPFQPVFAPYACTLCLPFMPRMAADSLQQMRTLGMFGRLGFLDAVDFTPSRVPEEADFSLVRMQDAAHQAALLCAVCNALTKDALRRCFTDIPMAGAGTLLLYRDTQPLVLPPPQRYPLSEHPPEPPFRRAANPAVSPADAHLIGSGRMGLLVGAQGSSVIRAAGRDVTRFTGEPWTAEGPQLYLAVGGETCRLLDPTLPGSVVFSEGMARFTRACGDLTATITMLVDPVSAAAVQAIEINSQSALEQPVELTCCLVPAATGPVTRPQERMLTVPCHGATLIHSLHVAEKPEALAVQTDFEAFPGWLEEDLTDGVMGSSIAPCMAFRARMTLPPHGKAAAMFATRLVSGKLTGYQPPDLSSLTMLSRLAARSLSDSLPLSQKRLVGLSRLTGALMWRGQAHQGASRPLVLPADFLASRGIRLERPILTVALSSGNGLPLLREAADTAGWLLLSGRSVTLCAVCGGQQPSETASLAEDLLSATILRRHPEGSAFVLDDLSENEFATLCAASRLVLAEGQGTAEAQLASLLVPLTADAPEPAAPGSLPDPGDLLFDDGLSGFDPQTGDCVIHLEPGQTAPQDWRLPLDNGRWATTARISGLGDSCAGQRMIRREDVFILGEDDSLFSATPEPMGRALPWEIRFAPGVALWRTRTNALDTTLTAAAIPRRAAGLRTLRLRNRSDEEQRLTVHVAVSFDMGRSSSQTCLTPMTGGVTALSPLMPGSGFVTLTEGGCAVRVMTEADLHGAAGAPPLPDAPSSHNGTVAMLSMEVSLLPGGSATVTWMTGYAQHADDIELLLHRVQRSGASAVYRSVRQLWGQRSGGMVFATPEPSLDLLLNHWLPCQFLQSEEPLALAAQSLLAPENVRPRLLLMARDHTADDLLPWLTAHYVRVTGDEAALNDLVPHDDEHPRDARDTLYARCLQALKTEPTGGLRNVFLRCAALRDFAELADEPDQVDLMTLLDHLTRDVEAHWHGNAYADEPGRLDALTAAWAVLGLGSHPRTAETVRSTLTALYDPMHGLVASANTPDAPQDTLAAVWLAIALARLGWSDRAWELARALNPIHHTDDPHRTAEYRGEPYAMASHVHTAAPHTGRAGHALSAEAAAMMYLLIVEELLGVERRGEQLLLRPLAPEDWDDFSLTLRSGASIWHFQFDGRASCVVDGEPSEAAVTLADDGGVHEVQAPIHAKLMKEI